MALAGLSMGTVRRAQAVAGLTSGASAHAGEPTPCIGFRRQRARTGRGPDGQRRGVETGRFAGVTMGAGVYFGSLQLYAATTLPTFCRLATHQDAGVTGMVKDRDTPAILGDGSLAYLMHVQTRYGERPEGMEWEWFVHAFGEQGPQLVGGQGAGRGPSRARRRQQQAR